MMRRLIRPLKHVVHHYDSKRSVNKLLPIQSTRRHSALLANVSLHRNNSLNLTQNALLMKLREDSSKTIPLLKFSEMIRYSHSTQRLSEMINKRNNKKTKKNDHHLIESAEFVRKQLELIFARIIIDFEYLPYGVCDNERIHEIMQNYINSYLELKSMANIKCIKSKNEFNQTLEKYLKWTQVSLVQNLCLGLLEHQSCDSLNKHSECPYLSHFIDRIVTRRLAARVLISHYLSLNDNNEWGVVEEDCKITDHLENAINDSLKMASKIWNKDKLPKITINDQRIHKNENFAFLPKLLHQFSFELIKNSIRAIMENNQEISIFSSTTKETMNNAKGEINIVLVNAKNGDVTVKVADNGGGISRNEMDKIWRYSYTSSRRDKSKHSKNGKNGQNGQHENGVNGHHKNGVNVIDDLHNIQMQLLKQSASIEQRETTKNPIFHATSLHDNAPMFGLGYGLPLIKAYSKYFGGSCEIHSIDGYGTDAYLYLPTLNISTSNVLYID